MTTPKAAFTFILALLLACVPVERVTSSDADDMGDLEELPCCICDGVWCPCEAPPELWCPNVEQGWPDVCLEACGV
jgi:hypothetical protein